MGAGTAEENTGAIGAAAVLLEGEPARQRQAAADRLAREMEDAARVSGRLAERLGRMMSAEKIRRRAAWTKSRGLG
ncbi:MAG: hypothetical protein ACE149_17340 [Armatimonadota bacterium]